MLPTLDALISSLTLARDLLGGDRSVSVACAPSLQGEPNAVLTVAIDFAGQTAGLVVGPPAASRHEPLPVRTADVSGSEEYRRGKLDGLRYGRSIALERKRYPAHPGAGAMEEAASIAAAIGAEIRRVV